MKHLDLFSILFSILLVSTRRISAHTSNFQANPNMLAAIEEEINDIENPLYGQAIFERGRQDDELGPV